MTTINNILDIYNKINTKRYQKLSIGNTSKDYNDLILADNVFLRSTRHLYPLSSENTYNRCDRFKFTHTTKIYVVGFRCYTSNTGNSIKNYLEVNDPHNLNALLIIKQEDMIGNLDMNFINNNLNKIYRILAYDLYIKEFNQELTYND